MAHQDDARPSQAPQARGRGAWWYLLVLGILVAAGVLAAILFFSGGEDDGWLWNVPDAVVGFHGR